MLVAGCEIAKSQIDRETEKITIQGRIYDFCQHGPRFDTCQSKLELAWQATLGDDALEDEPD
jgi:hypothetical protein